MRRLAARSSTIALVLALAVALGLLYLIDRSIAQTQRTQAELEVVESAALVEGFLAVHAQALRSLRVALGEQDDTTLTELVQHLAEHAPSIRQVWLTDSAGRVQWEHDFQSSAPGIRGVDIDTLTTLRLGALAGHARADGGLQISPPGRIFTGERGFAMLEPLFRRGVFAGFAGGTLTSEALLQEIADRHAHRAGQLIVLRDQDTVAATTATARRPRAGESSRAAIRAPGSTGWEMVVVHTAADAQLRFLLWGVGLATIISVAVVLRDERRQAQRLAERTAELERLSTELLRANRAKSEFLANVSHELRTPLNAIVGFVDLLRDGVYGQLESRQVGPVDRIASSAGHLRQLVDQVLDIAKMAAGRLEVHPETIDLRAFVLDVVSEMESLITERGLNLSLTIPTTLPRVRSDPLHLRQIMLNLLSNAVQYTPSGGIAIRAKLVQESEAQKNAPTDPLALRQQIGGAPGEWIMLQVADTGIGIALADQARVFEEFEQVNAGSRSESMRRGTGLGLAISRRLARLLGGDVTLESELGKGATFTVWLPAVRSAGGNEPEPRALASSSEAV